MTLVLAPHGSTTPARALATDPGCRDCGFQLWNPIATLSVSRVGLYDDGRFPGRVIVSAIDHYEHLDEADPDILAMFMSDVQRVSAALRSLPGVERTNMAILGNQEPHLHAHVFPRRPGELNAGRAPWDGAPTRRPNDPATLQHLRHQLSTALRAR